MKLKARGGMDCQKHHAFTRRVLSDAQRLAAQERAERLLAGGSPQILIPLLLKGCYIFLDNKALFSFSVSAKNLSSAKPGVRSRWASILLTTSSALIAALDSAPLEDDVILRR